MSGYATPPQVHGKGPRLARRMGPPVRICEGSILVVKELLSLSSTCHTQIFTDHDIPGDAILIEFSLKPVSRVHVAGLLGID
jgi:hypothetical protein